jgi:hypothetical protein
MRISFTATVFAISSAADLMRIAGWPDVVFTGTDLCMHLRDEETFLSNYKVMFIVFTSPVFDFFISRDFSFHHYQYPAISWSGWIFVRSLVA